MLPDTGDLQSRLVTYAVHEGSAMAAVQTPTEVEVATPAKSVESQSISVAASAGPNSGPVLVEGRLGAPKVNARVTGEPVLGPPQFFPANPAKVEELAENKPLKQLKSNDRSSSGGLLRTISDVITELRGKHQNKKRVRLARFALSQSRCLHTCAVQVLLAHICILQPCIV